MKFQTLTLFVTIWFVIKKNVNSFSCLLRYANMIDHCFTNSNCPISFLLYRNQRFKWHSK